MVVLIVLAWAPWLTEEFALSLVVRHLGGEAAEFFYLGETMTVGEVPKTLRGYGLFSRRGNVRSDLLRFHHMNKKN